MPLAVHLFGRWYPVPGEKWRKQVVDWVRSFQDRPLDEARMLADLFSIAIVLLSVVASLPLIADVLIVNYGGKAINALGSSLFQSVILFALFSMVALAALLPSRRYYRSKLDKLWCSKSCIFCGFSANGLPCVGASPGFHSCPECSALIVTHKEDVEVRRPFLREQTVAAWKLLDSHNGECEGFQNLVGSIVKTVVLLGTSGMLVSMLMVLFEAFFPDLTSWIVRPLLGPLPPGGLSLMLQTILSPILGSGSIFAFPILVVGVLFRLLIRRDARALPLMRSFQRELFLEYREQRERNKVLFGALASLAKPGTNEEMKASN